MSKLYHSAPIILGIGSVILPGNWGRVIKAVGESHPHWHSERILEDIRATHYSHLPSRLNSCFGCTDVGTLIFYNKVAVKNSPIEPILYEVEKVDPVALEHRADFNLIRANLPSESMEQQAHRYWSGKFWYEIPGREDQKSEEFLTSSGLRIIRIIERTNS